jgi:malic enzyme
VQDFKTPKAEMLLKRYRSSFRCFNDDIQGTGAVTLAGLLAAHRKVQTPFTQSKIVCVGAGSAGLGVCNALVDGMVRMGLTPAEARSRFWLVDDKARQVLRMGLFFLTMTSVCPSHSTRWGHNHAPAHARSKL